MRKLILIVYLFAIQLGIFSQQINHFVISSSGNQYASNNIIFDWTLGEVFTETSVGGGFVLNQGFHQPLIEIKTAINQVEFSGLNIFPNPVSDKLTLNFPDAIANKSNCVITDLQGRLYINREIKEISTEFDFSTFSSGIYFLRIISENPLINVSQKIIKK